MTAKRPTPRIVAMAYVGFRADAETVAAIERLTAAEAGAGRKAPKSRIAF